MTFRIIFLISLITSIAFGQTYIKGPALVEGLTSTVTAAGVTSLSNTSQTNQQFTGATTQTVVLPNATTLPVGRYFQLQNRSTGILSVQTFGGAALTSVYPGTQKQVLVTNVGSAAGTWDVTGINVTDVAGVLPLINGGTNKAMTASSGAIVYSDADSFELDGTHLNWNAAIQQLTLNADGASYTAAPANTIFHTVGNNGATSRLVFDSHNSGVNGSYLLGRHARGTAALPTAVNSGDTLLGVAGIGYGATGYPTNGSAYMLIRASETFTDTSTASNIQFHTTPTGSTAPVQRVYIESTGHVSIGTSVPAASAKLDIQGTDGALLIPRMTTAQKNALTATAGMTVYDTTLGSFSVYDGSWKPLMSNPMTNGGDIIYGGASGLPTRLSNGSSGQVLTSQGGTNAPAWAAQGTPSLTVLTATSDVKTPPSAATMFFSLSNNSLTITPGTWELSCGGKFTQSGGSAIYTAYGTGIYSTNGTDAATVPTLLTSTPNLTVNSNLASDTGLTWIIFNKQEPTVQTAGGYIVTASANVTLYCVGYGAATNFNNARITTHMTARKIY